MTLGKFTTRVGETNFHLEAKSLTTGCGQDKQSTYKLLGEFYKMLNFERMSVKVSTKINCFLERTETPDVCSHACG